MWAKRLNQVAIILHSCRKNLGQSVHGIKRTFSKGKQATKLRLVSAIFVTLNIELIKSSVIIFCFADSSY